MKIALLSRNKDLYSSKRIIEAAMRRGHEVDVIDYLRCYMNITSKKPTIIYQGRELSDIDAVIPRIGASYTFYGTAIVRQFETMGKYSVNGSVAISRSRDKLRSLQILAKRGIGLPITGFAHSPKDVAGVINVVGGAPLVIKILEGTQGIGVVLAETKKASESVIEAFRGLDVNILVQEYIEESKGADVRCFVVGDKVAAAMIRKAKDGEFRANIHRGGRAEKIKITPEERRMAVQATKEMGLSVAGVDLLRSKKGPLVIEINSSPGLEGVEKATGIDVADAIIEFIERNLSKGKKQAIKVKV